MAAEHAKKSLISIYRSSGDILNTKVLLLSMAKAEGMDVVRIGEVWHSDLLISVTRHQQRIATGQSLETETTSSSVIE